MLPEELFAIDLSHPEFRLASALYHLGGAVRPVDATMDELEVLTRMKAESLRRALRGLEGHGLVETVRTRKEFNKFSKNKYRLILPSLKNEGRSPEPSLESEGSTHGYVVPPSWLAITTMTTSNTNLRNTTYFSKRASGAIETKEVLMWKSRGEDTSGDDNVGGFGLFEEELEARKPVKKVSKKDPFTRNERPIEEWTTADVAAEFSHRIWQRFPQSVKLVNRQRIAGALRKYRSENDTNASIEMEILNMFFADEANFRDVETHPEYVLGRFLKMFKTHMNKALERLGLEPNRRVLESALAPKVEKKYLVASDGQKFDTGIAGRRALENYEKRLKENQNAV